MINKVTLIGNLGQDPEIRNLEGGNIMAKFSLATSENYKDKNGQKQTKTEWHNIVLWGKLAEIAQSYLSKGSKIYLEGKISYKKWTNDANEDRWMTQIIGNSFQMLDKRENGHGDTYGSPQTIEEYEKDQTCNHCGGDVVNDNELCNDCELSEHIGNTYG